MAPPSSQSEILDRLPPQNLDAEMGVLGSVLLDPGLFDEVSPLLVTDDFYGEANRKLFAHISRMHGEGGRIDLTLLVERLRRDGDYEAVGGAAYLTEVMHAVPVAAHAVHYAKLVVDKSHRRAIIHGSTEMLRAAWDEGESVESIVGRCEQVLQGVSTGEYEGEPVEFNDALLEATMAIDRIAARKGTAGVMTGLENFDLAVGGLFPGELIILAARPSIGKTALALQIAAHMGLYRGVYFASLEMSSTQLASRVLCAHSGVAMARVRAVDLGPDDFALLAAAGVDLHGLNILLHDRAGLTVQDIRRACRRLAAKGDLALIVVDYLQRVTPDDRGAPRHLQVGKITWDLKALALELNVPVLCLCQLSRVADERDKKTGLVVEPRLGMLKECLAVDSTLLFTQAGVRGNMASPMSLYTWNNKELTVAETENITKRRSPTIMVRLRSGRYLQCTKKHRVMTDRGWVEASKLTIEHAVACVHVLAPPRNAILVPHARWMGWMLGNGHIQGFGSPGFICGDRALAAAFVQATEDLFNLTPRPLKHWSGNVFQYGITRGYHTSKPNPCKSWLKAHDMWGNKAACKVIPDWFLAKADNASIAEIVAGMVDTDGSIPQMRTRRRCVQYTTTSRTMAYQFLWCLSRLGVYGRIDGGYTSTKATTPLYKICIDDGVEVQKFRDVVTLTGRKGRRLEAAHLATTGSNHGNRLGAWVGAELVAHAKAQGISSARLGYRDQGKRIGRDNLGRLLGTLEKEHPRLRALTNPAIYWDRLRDIKPAGTAQVFDRSVPRTHNFVANGIIVHNSGDIEQDADMVLLLHRQNRALEALAILAKNRQGEQGRFRWEWDGERMRFSVNGGGATHAGF